MAAVTSTPERYTVMLLVVLGSAAPAGVQGQIPDPAGVPLGLDLYMPGQPDVHTGPDAVALGRMLFFDPILSRDSSLACASCHRPERAFTDGRRTASGVAGARGSRNVPTLVNRGYGHSFFWDGRAETLQSQVLQPIEARAEMDLRIGALLQRLERHGRYAVGFRRLFQRAPDSEGLAQALASYVRSIRAADSSFDRFVDGEREALDAPGRRGLELFQGRARCVRCHLGPLFTDEAFHNTGIAWRGGGLADSGRAAISGRPEDLGAFKTPTLREIARTAPYMHDGSVESLEEVIEFYARGGESNPYLDAEIRALDLTEQDRLDLVAFLRSLSGRIVEGRN
ncbi:MAG: cytochrome c peroxidase [Gemmatimonadota bacterium]